jgi:hypothetical protein
MAIYMERWSTCSQITRRVGQPYIYKGNSSSLKLFNLVLRFRKLEIDQGAHFHAVHCSGERMKAEGADGVSQGHLKEGVTAGMDMMSFIPLNKTCFEREPKLKDWFKSWAGAEAEFLEPSDWFGRGHDHNGGRHCQARSYGPLHLLRPRWHLRN